jgi:hypothetical protein
MSIGRIKNTWQRKHKIGLNLSHHLIRFEGLSALCASDSSLPMVAGGGPFTAATRSFDDPLKSLLNIAFIINKRFSFSRS